MRARTGLGILITAGWVYACSEVPPAADLPQVRVCFLDGLGVSFELPADWQADQALGGAVFAGPGLDDSAYTTLTVQGVPRAETLSESLARVAGPLTELPRFALLYNEAAVVDARAALRYGLQVETHETLFVRHAVLVDGPRHHVDLSYAAVPELAPLGFAIFEHALATLSVFTPVEF